MLSDRPHPTFLTEHYRPSKHERELRQLGARISAAMAGSGIQLVCAIVVADDDALYCVIEGSTETAIREAYSRSGITFDRISAATAEIEAVATRQ